MRSFQVSAHGAAIVVPMPGIVRARPRSATFRGDPVIADACTGAATQTVRSSNAIVLITRDIRFIDTSVSELLLCFSILT